MSELAGFEGLCLASNPALPFEVAAQQMSAGELSAQEVWLSGMYRGLEDLHRLGLTAENLQAMLAGVVEQHAQLQAEKARRGLPPVFREAGPWQ